MAGRQRSGFFLALVARAGFGLVLLLLRHFLRYAWFHLVHVDHRNFDPALLGADVHVQIGWLNIKLGQVTSFNVDFGQFAFFGFLHIATGEEDHPKAKSGH